MSKRTLSLSILLTLLSVLGGCAEKPASPEDPLTAWREAAQLDAQETPEMLYRAALLEDTLVVYSTSTRMMDASKSFEKQYPGLLVRVEDIREEEMYSILQNNYDEQRYGCDVVCSADGRGIMANEFIPKGIVAKYVPYDMASHLLADGCGEEALLTFASEALMLCYNDAVYDEQPVGNWWELTEKKWRGKVYTSSPLRSVTTGMTLGTIVANDEAMRQAYLQRYGVLPDTRGESAGMLFIRRLVENGLVFVNSSDEISERIGEPARGSDSLGIMVSSKLRLRDIGYSLTMMEGLVPFDGIASPINISIAGGSRNINSAKLFIRWILGEADGQGEGYLPYIQTGAWPLRDDVRGAEGFSPENMQLLPPEKRYLYDNRDALNAFFREMIAEALGE